MFEERLQNIEVRIKYALEHYTSHLVFRALKHLNPKATVGQIEAFEKDLGFTLPEDYRQFILIVGDGGFGPELGLYSLTNFSSGSDRVGAYPFPFRYLGECSIADWGMLTGHEKMDSDIALDLSSNDTGLGYFLVISGEERGNIWQLSVEDEVAVPLENQGVPCSFLDWYELWLTQFFFGKEGHPF